MNRAELISRATEAMRNTACSHRGEPDHPDVDGWGLCEVCDATAALDVILPQVATLEELEALPVGTLLVSNAGGMEEIGRSTPEMAGWQYAAQLMDEFGPLTVAWRP